MGLSLPQPRPANAANEPKQAIVPASPEASCARPTYRELIDQRSEPERIVAFLDDLDRLHDFYRQLNSTDTSRGNFDHLAIWASEIGRTHFVANESTPHPVGAQRVHMLEILSEAKISNASIVRELLLADATAGAASDAQAAGVYADYLLRQVVHSGKLDAAGQFIAFPCHFEPGAALLAMRHWAHRLTPEQFDASMKLLGPMLNWWYG